MLIVCASLHAETIIDHSDLVLKGRIGEFNQNGVKFYSDKYYVIQLNDIKDAYVDDSVSAQEKELQQKNIDRLSKVIDKESYLVKGLGEEIRELLSQEKYTELGLLAERFVKQKEQFPSGNWKIYHFYAELKNDIENRDIGNYLKRIDQVEDWVDKVPNSTTAKIALMGVMRDLAWAYRGYGYSKTVSHKGSKNYKTILEKVVE